MVASIPPLHSLAAGVMEGVGEPAQLLDGGQSPHTFHLRPSHVRLLARADLVLWVGEALEAPLAGSLKAHSGSARVVELMALPGLEPGPARAAGVWEREHDHGSHGAEDDHGHHHGHHDGDEDRPAAKSAAETTAGGDPHLWLSPDNAMGIVNRLAEELATLDPPHAARYRANAEALAVRIGELDRAIEARLAPVRHQPYLVFHDAYGVFEQHYRLNAVGSVTLSPERPPGARRIHELRGRIAATGARCLFSEPQFEPHLVVPLIEGSDTRTGVLDPIGAHLRPGPDAWFRLMEGLADSLAECLGDEGSTARRGPERG